MPSVLERKPLHVLAPAALALLLLLVVVSRLAAPNSAADPRPPLAVTGVESLFEPRVTQAQIVARANAMMRAQGLDPDRYFHAVWLRLDRALFDDLRAEHGDAALVDFVERGAPLVGWGVSYYQPIDKVTRYAGTSVTLDHTGAAIGFARWQHDVNALRTPISDAWIADAKQRVAAELGLDPTSLRPRSPSAFAGTTLARADAIWELTEPRLGSARVVVTATDRAGMLTFTKQVFDPAQVTFASDVAATTAYWAAILLAIAIAFALGLCARRGAVAELDAPAPTVIAAGFAFAAAVCAAHGVISLGASGTAVRYGGVGMLAAAALLAGGAVLAWRASRDTAGAPPAIPRWIQIGLIATVAVSFVAMSVACTGLLDRGCTRACGAMRYSSAPLTVIALIAAAHRSRFTAIAIAFAATALVPHCHCDNFLNHPWIARIGLSPMCYFAPFVATLIAALGLRGVHPRACLAVVALGSVGIVLIGIGHQVFGFPW